MSLNEIIMLERQRVLRDKMVLHTIYDRMKNRINNAVRARSKVCIYTVPELLPGYPLVKLGQTMRYLINKLQREGFIAFAIDTKQIYITWDPLVLRDLDQKLRKEELANKSTEFSNSATSYITREMERYNDDMITGIIDKKKVFKL
jgi:hypothetical protein